MFAADVFLTALMDCDLLFLRLCSPRVDVITFVASHTMSNMSWTNKS